MTGTTNKLKHWPITELDYQKTFSLPVLCLYLSIFQKQLFLHLNIVYSVYYSLTLSNHIKSYYTNIVLATMTDIDRSYFKKFNTFELKFQILHIFCTPAAGLSPKAPERVESLPKDHSNLDATFLIFIKILKPCQHIQKFYQHLILSSTEESIP